MEMLALRAVERFSIVFIAGTSIVLGYKLFAKVPFDKDAEGRFQLPGGTTLQLARIGPGAFFALFGAAILSIALFMPYTEEKTGANYADNSSTAFRYSTEEIQSGQNQISIKETAACLEHLTKLEEYLDLWLREHNTIIDRRWGQVLLGEIPNIKLNLIRSVWVEKEMGSFEQFYKCILGGDYSCIKPSQKIWANHLTKQF